MFGEYRYSQVHGLKDTNEHFFTCSCKPPYLGTPLFLHNGVLHFTLYSIPITKDPFWPADKPSPDIIATSVPGWFPYFPYFHPRRIKKRPPRPLFPSLPTISFIFKRLFGSFAAPSPAAMSAAKTKAQGLIDDNAVMVFSKSYCPYCTSTKGLLQSFDANVTVLELDEVGELHASLLLLSLLFSSLPSRSWLARLDAACVRCSGYPSMPAAAYFPVSWCILQCI